MDNGIMYKTFVNGFDEVLGGGIPRGHVVLIMGAPGTMKSSLGYSTLFHNAKKAGIPGAYISLEQNRSSLVFQMSKLGMNPEPKDKLKVIDVATIRKNMAKDSGGWLDSMKAFITHLRNNYKIELLVVDSLQALKVLGGLEEGKERESMFRLFEWLREMKITTFLVAETVGPGRSERIDVEEYLADGIIYLTMVKVGKIDFHRRIRCVKMRGVDHNTSYYALEFKDRAFRATLPI